MSGGQLAMPGFRRKLFDTLVQRWNAASQPTWYYYIGARFVYSHTVQRITSVQTN